jgi:hypothetical protein
MYSCHRERALQTLITLRSTPPTVTLRSTQADDLWEFVGEVDDILIVTNGSGNKELVWEIEHSGLGEEGEVDLQLEVACTEQQRRRQGLNTVRYRVHCIPRGRLDPDWFP